MTDATVCVDVTLTEDLEAEGYAREVIRRLQEMRKQAGLNVDDTVAVSIHVADARVSKLIESWKDSIAGEVRAVKIEMTSDPGAVNGGIVQEWDVEGIAMKMAVTRA